MLAFAFAELFAGCSGGGLKHAFATTTKVTTSSTAATTTTTVSPAPVAINLGACPSRYGDETSTGADVRELGNKLVPIAALSVRVCKYGVDQQPVGRAVLLSGSGSTLIEDATNSLFVPPGRGGMAQHPTGPCGPGPVYVTLREPYPPRQRHRYRVWLRVERRDPCARDSYVARRTRGLHPLQDDPSVNAQSRRRHSDHGRYRLARSPKQRKRSDRRNIVLFDLIHCRRGFSGSGVGVRVTVTPSTSTQMRRSPQGTGKSRPASY